MLMSDMWQPAVLQLLPFSPNSASLPHHHHHHHPHSSLTPTPYHPFSSSSPSPRPRSFPVTTDTSATYANTGREFPVLAVTRKEKNEAGSGSKGVSSGSSGSGGGGGGGWGGSWTSPSSSVSPSARARALSERLTRSQTFVDASGGAGNGVSSTDRTAGRQLRVRSEYMMSPRRCSAGMSAAANGGNISGNSSSRVKSSGPQSREQTTCCVTDMNEWIIPRVGISTETISPDSGAGGSLRNFPAYVTSATPETGSPNGGSSSRGAGLPRPAFPANALCRSNSSAVGVIGNGSSCVGEGRFVVFKNGMYRTVTLTPGEMELKRHRDLLERVTMAQPSPATGKGESKGDSKVGQQYHKMNIKDLPRSTTPVNDHDPDKLNMKQVIAFLQSKGKSQADAVELPRGPKSKVKQAVTLPRAIQSGVFRGSSVRKPTTSSPATDVLVRSAAVRHAPRDPGDLSPPSAGQREREDGGGGGDTLRSSSSSLPRSHTAVSRKPSAREGRERRREVSRQRTLLEKEEDATASARQLQKKPFRLHRFLTMVPSARDPAALSSPSLASADTCPMYSAVPLGPPSSKHAHKERTLCLDLAHQSRTQTTPSKSTDSKQQGKVHYRLTARPRPSSLIRVEQDLSEAQWKLSADFGERDLLDRLVTFADSTDNTANTKDTKKDTNVIRLPFVLVDSEDEDAGFRSEARKSARPQKRTHNTKSPHRNLDETQTKKDQFPNEAEYGDSLWPTDVNEIQDLHTSSQISTTDVAKEEQEFQSSSRMSSSSSLLPAPTECSSSLPTVAPSDVVSDDIHTVEDSANKLPDLVPEGGLIHPAENKDGKDPDRPATNKKVRVNLPNHNDPPKDSASKQKLPDCVTLSLRKERHRTRENTYMSEIGGSDVFCDDTCSAQANSDSLRMSFRSDDVTSLAS